MANLVIRTNTCMEQIKKILDYFVKESMPTTLEEVAGADLNEKHEEYEMLYDMFIEYKDLAETYAEKVDKMSSQLDDIQKTLKRWEDDYGNK